jgi:hypothetical protein
MRLVPNWDRQYGQRCVSRKNAHRVKLQSAHNLMWPGCRQAVRLAFEAAPRPRGPAGAGGMLRLGHQIDESKSANRFALTAQARAGMISEPVR